ncbi:XrtA/PEP-CTERM system-associated ATPase [Futiania mangrovi]|uniref:XrtA-associated ATPase n=1 Tax=Futiania mangrovi TaxID=2959716 RepID=A0A9J6PBM4_9PROT|nr:XrtA/PEP-CTERM system-associated ATPase [Futiania mangrovii]MCP1335897.1 XrtA-associated ATPase [Futiania mangrovii]
MFEEYYGFTSSPFRLTPDHRFFYGSEGHKKAMSYLKYGLYQGEGFIVITGDVGTGKSTLVSQLFAELNADEIVAAQIGTTHIDAEDAVRMIVRAFKIKTEGSDKASQLTALEDFLQEQYHAGRRVLLVVDEAQNLPARTLEELRMLSNFNVNGESLFQIFLVGQPQFLRYLANPDLVQLQQRVIASYKLKPLSPAECRAYIEHRLLLAGWTGVPDLTDGALNAIYRETKGVPRRINTLCNRVLLYGALEELSTIDEAAVNEVVKDLQGEVHAAPQTHIDPAADMDPHAPRPGESAAARPGPQMQDPRDKVFDDTPVYGDPEPINPDAAAPALQAAAAAPNTELMRRIDRIETALLAHDRALRELIDTAASYLSTWQGKDSESGAPALDTAQTALEEEAAPALSTGGDDDGAAPPLAFKRNIV